MFTLAHLSDPHLGPLPAPRPLDLLGKRLTGYINYRRHRHAIHDMPTLHRVVADLARMAPDHIALTGDVVNIGLPAEFEAARAFLEQLGPPERVTLIPGNHDAYVADSLRAMRESLGRWMADDDGRPAFPALRVRGEVALIAVNSGIPTAPFLASGALGVEQREALATLLRETRARGLIRIVLIHHPPHHHGARFGRGLRDARQLEGILLREGAELVLHGHNHVHSMARLPGPGGTVIPILGVASASAVPGSAHHRAQYHLLTLQRAAGGVSVGVEVRSVTAAGTVETSARHQLSSWGQ